MGDRYVSQGSRALDSARSEYDLAINIKKATSPEETAPKQKHVRSCIVYTWDHRSSLSFWAGLKVQPILADEVIREGHPVVLRECQPNSGWIESCGRAIPGEGARGYGPLVRAYVDFLLSKMGFHRTHPAFNGKGDPANVADKGTFEYEEYLSLKTIDDPNEGYETISDLMNLQDQTESFQKLVFSHFRPSSNNECRIAALVPLLQESYGIYRFITSMLRAMHQATQSEEALEPLRSRYASQHYRLLKFYYECSNLRYLTSLVTVPKLPQDPPNLIDDDAPPTLPRRPAQEIPQQPSLAPPQPPSEAEPIPINEFWNNEQVRQQAEYDHQQRTLQAQREAEQQQFMLQRQREMEMQQQLEAQRQDELRQHQLAMQQQQEYEAQQQLLRAQRDAEQLQQREYEERQMHLQAQRESELEQQRAYEEQQRNNLRIQIESLQEQLSSWRTKYEALAKLYSQLRQEHLDLLSKHKQMQLKASSAQEAIDRREKIEREMKSKNVEMADMLRERDRALQDLERLKGSHREELERVQRELRLHKDQIDNAEKTKGSEMSSLVGRYTREITDLETTLRRALTNAETRVREIEDEIAKSSGNRDEEIEIYKAGMDSALLQLNELRMNHHESDRALDSQIDDVLRQQLGKLNDIIDAVLQSGVRRIDDALYELDSPMQAGNQNSSGGYLLSVIEKASASATHFATAFNNFIADGPNGDHSEIIKTTHVFASALADVLSNAKGITRLLAKNDQIDALLGTARGCAMSTEKFLSGLQSSRLATLNDDAKTDRVISSNLEVQRNLQKLSKMVEGFIPKSTRALEQTNGDLGDVVDGELGNAARAIEAASQKLSQLLLRPKEDTYSTNELKIHDAILEAAVAVTNAIAQLIKAATDSQQEIVAQGRGNSSRTAFYKKNNRWTEGLISAAQAVAHSTKILIETADGVVNGHNSAEQLIVACNEVAASTAQLVAASRVKATFMSRTQDRLENASKTVTKACRDLVNRVQEILASRNQAEEEFDYTKLSAHEFKVQEMEQQVEILKLENELSSARRRLGDMRKVSYQSAADADHADGHEH